MLNHHIYLILIIVLNWLIGNEGFIINYSISQRNDMNRFLIPSSYEKISSFKIQRFWNKNTQHNENQGDQSSQFNKINEDGSDVNRDENGFLISLLNSKYSVIIELLAIFFTLSGIDGGFSGDWSKYGFITKSTELFLQYIVIIDSIIRIFLSAVVYQMCKQSNQPFVFPILKVLLIGELAFAKFYFQRLYQEK